MTTRLGRPRPLTPEEIQFLLEALPRMILEVERFASGLCGAADMAFAYTSLHNDFELRQRLLRYLRRRAGLRHERWSSAFSKGLGEPWTPEGKANRLRLLRDLLQLLTAVARKEPAP